MAEKRKGRKRKEEYNPNGDEKPEKPDPEEYKVAEWMRKNIQLKKTKFLNHNVEYFTGSKAVDGLMESKWAKPVKEGEEALFFTRMDVVEFLDKMLRHKFFHRAKKVPVSEQELKAKMKKKVKKEDKKEEEKPDEKKKKEEEAAESSHAEGKEAVQQEPNWVKPRGVLQRNRALSWLRANLNPAVDRGVIYFADDDNSYSLKIFDEMRGTREVSVWPVGLVGGLLVEKPVVNVTTGRVSGWNSQWRPERPFPIDMAGFAINLQHLLRHPEVKFLLEVRGGWQESELLRGLTTRDRLQPLAEKCSKVYVWHTRTEKPVLNMEEKLRAKGLRSDLGMEV